MHEESLRNADLNFSNALFFSHSPADNKYQEEWVPSFLHWWIFFLMFHTGTWSFLSIPKIGQADTKVFFPFCYMNAKVKQMLKEYKQTEPQI